MKNAPISSFPHYDSRSYARRLFVVAAAFSWCFIFLFLFFYFLFALFLSRNYRLLFARNKQFRKKMFFKCIFVSPLIIFCAGFCLTANRSEKRMIFVCVVFVSSSFDVEMLLVIINKYEPLHFEGASNKC